MRSPKAYSSHDERSDLSLDKAETQIQFTFPEKTSFKCSRCTICCGDTDKRIRHILLLPDEAGSISQTISLPVKKFALRRSGSSPYDFEIKKRGQDRKCFFLQGSNCSIYDSRPLICRFYPFELCVKEGHYSFEPTTECPTIGIGEILKRDYFENLFRQADRLFARPIR